MRLGRPKYPRDKRRRFAIVADYDARHDARNQSAALLRGQISHELTLIDHELTLIDHELTLMNHE